LRMRSQLMRCCQSSPAMPKFAVPIVPPPGAPRGALTEMLGKS
jgi:hypothetical protein